MQLKGDAKEMQNGVKRWMVLATIVATIMFLGAQVCVADNLLANPGFETPILLKGGWTPSWVENGWTGIQNSISGNAYTVRE